MKKDKNGKITEDCVRSTSGAILAHNVRWEEAAKIAVFAKRPVKWGGTVIGEHFSQPK